LDLLLEPRDAHFDVARFVRVQPAARTLVQPSLDAIGFVAKTVGRAVADAIAPVEPVDLALDLINPRLERANLAPAVVVAIGPLLRVILGCGRACGDESRACSSNGNDELTHNGSPWLSG
jgi:hypothetical protein